MFFIDVLLFNKEFRGRLYQSISDAAGGRKREVWDTFFAALADQCAQSRIVALTIIRNALESCWDEKRRLGFWHTRLEVSCNSVTGAAEIWKSSPCTAGAFSCGQCSRAHKGKPMFIIEQNGNTSGAWIHGVCASTAVRIRHGSEICWKNNCKCSASWWLSRYGRDMSQCHWDR